MSTPRRPGSAKGKWSSAKKTPSAKGPPASSARKRPRDSEASGSAVPAQKKAKVVSFSSSSSSSSSAAAGAALAAPSPPPSPFSAGPPPERLSTKDYLRRYVSDLLPTTVQGQASFDKKLKDKVLMLSNPAKAPDTAAAEQQAKRRKAGQKRRNFMTAKEKKERGIFAIGKDSLRWDDLYPLHQLWQGYMRELLQDEAKSGRPFDAKLARADFHGAIFTVERSKSPSFVGITGIVIVESAETFKLLTKDNKVKIVPKAPCVFSFTVLNHSVLLFGQQLCFRAAERMARKWSNVPSIELA